MDWRLKAHRAAFARTRVGVVAVLVAALAVVAGTAAAATVVDEEKYHLREGEVVADDLVVFARDIIIDGTVQGDLVAFGQFIAVNGVVEQDVIAAGAEVQVNGIVQDDVRAAGAAVRVNGRVGDDLFMAGGGFFAQGFGAIPIPMGERSVDSGISTGGEAAIGGDAYVAGGLATLAGVFRGDLFAGVAELFFDATVEGDANLQTGGITFGEGARVAGNLTYSAETESGSPTAGGVVTKTEPEQEAAAAPTAAGRQGPSAAGFGWWLMRTLLIIVGLGLVGAVLLALGGRAVTGPADAIARQPAIAGLYGAVIAMAAVPISAALVFLAALFFGWFWGGLAAFAFTSGFLLLAWVLSPVITGLWLGRQIFSWMKIERGDLVALLVGASLIVLTARILGATPCAGALIYLLIYLSSFALAAGGILLSMMRGDALDAASPLVSDAA